MAKRKNRDKIMNDIRPLCLKAGYPAYCQLRKNRRRRGLMKMEEAKGFEIWSETSANSSEGFEMRLAFE